MLVNFTFIKSVKTFSRYFEKVYILLANEYKNCLLKSEGTFENNCRLSKIILYLCRRKHHEQCNQLHQPSRDATVVKLRCGQ